jgi:hypothetical protein
MWLWLLAMGCVVDEPTIPEGAPTAGQRAEVGFVGFDKWTDYLTLQAAVDQQCHFMDPLVEDNSTVWPPLQVFWVIYDDSRDVQEGDVLHDTFFVGDDVRAEDFPMRSDKEAIGFMFIPPLARGFLALDDVDVSAPDVMSAVLGPPLDVGLRIEVVAREGGCEFDTYAWAKDGGAEMQIDHLYVELGPLFTVKDVEFVE